MECITLVQLGNCCWISYAQCINEHPFQHLSVKGALHKTYTAYKQGIRINEPETKREREIDSNRWKSSFTAQVENFATIANSARPTIKTRTKRRKRRTEESWREEKTKSITNHVCYQNLSNLHESTVMMMIRILNVCGSPKQTAYTQHIGVMHSRPTEPNRIKWNVFSFSVDSHEREKKTHTACARLLSIASLQKRAHRSKFVKEDS